MLMIRLSRMGKKKRPSYRVVVSEKHKDPWGNYLEQVGFYDPLSEPKTVQFEKERILYWISQGAQPSETVHNLLVSAGVIDGKKIRATKGDIKKREEVAKAAAEKAKEESASANPPADEADAASDKTVEDKNEVVENVKTGESEAEKDADNNELKKEEAASGESKDT